ncbi:hypothetical protein [Nocardia sp. alder85J]|uniref:hypothetical protein n=1 Tax=Nocardia sp. alder85J TaxID=2862949 RepID=UPI001CD27D98|nr:hypothetical protein [Nocardia sp. alder85J]MCX4097910.1 hypothetical protein [Nocardia sp. alder85J]
MWLYAVWGCVGAAVNCGIIYVEATRRVKGWPWSKPHGPGGGPYAVSILVQLGIGAGAAAGIVDSGLIVTNVAASGLAFVIGTATPVVVKKVSQYVEALLPDEDDFAKKGHGDRDTMTEQPVPQGEMGLANRSRGDLESP